MSSGSDFALLPEQQFLMEYWRAKHNLQNSDLISGPQGDTYSLYNLQGFTQGLKFLTGCEVRQKLSFANSSLLEGLILLRDKVFPLF